jgi:hypothetical protein
MITIEYLSEEIEGEPGPNFYWRGKPSDFLKLLNDMHSLGCEETFEINLIELSYIELKGLTGVRAVSSSNGGFLCKKNDDAVLIDLTNSIWQELLQSFLAISFYPSHYYVDFDGMNFIEDANFIISSEA